MTTLYIIGILLLVICLVLIFFVSKSERIVNLAYKFNMCEKEINVFLNNKEELILRVIGIIGRQLNTEFKVFENVKNIKASKINNYDRDKLLSEAFLNIEKIYFDSLTTLSSENQTSGKDYLSVMNSNLEILKKELYKSE